MSSLPKLITPERIVNAVLMNKNHEGYNLFVEGRKDVMLYGQFTNKDNIKLILTDGKYKMRKVWSLLEENGYENKLAVRDADFIRVRDNYIYDYDDKFFITDYHDSECMIINSPTFDKFLSIILTEQQYNNLTNRYPALKETLEQLIYNLGCLKLANKLDKLGLVFKPKRSNEKNLDFSKFISTKTLNFKGNKELIQAVVNYSVNKVEHGTIKNISAIEQSLNKVLKANHPASEIVHGHDFSEMIYFLIRKHLKLNIAMINSSENVETMLTMSYDSQDFKSTNLYIAMNKIDSNENIGIFSI